MGHGLFQAEFVGCGANVESPVLHSSVADPQIVADLFGVLAHGVRHSAPFHYWCWSA